jgi:hypothetical protein
MKKLRYHNASCYFTIQTKNRTYDATFSDGSVVSFGAAGYSDFTQHKDEARKQNYIKTTSSQ